MLLDVGEGTMGQIWRMYGTAIATAANSSRTGTNASDTSAAAVLAGLRAIWISHPHADHYLGLPRVLSERQKVVPVGTPPLLLMAPGSVSRWLAQYEGVYTDSSSSASVLCCAVVMIDSLDTACRHQCIERCVYAVVTVVRRAFIAADERASQQSIVVWWLYVYKTEANRVLLLLLPLLSHTHTLQVLMAALQAATSLLITVLWLSLVNLIQKLTTYCSNLV
jgi:ribonuclease BN (tRNA processing enzyme)